MNQEGMSVAEIVTYAQTAHEETLSKSSVERHMSHHFQHTVTMRTLAEQSATKAMSQNVRILHDIYNTLDIARSIIKQLVGKTDMKDPAQIHTLVTVMEQFGKNLERAEKLQSKLQIKTELTETEILQLLIDVIGQDFPPALVGQIVERAKTKLKDLISTQEEESYGGTVN